MFLRRKTDTLRIMLYSCQNQFVISITSKVIWLSFWYICFGTVCIWEEWQ